MPLIIIVRHYQFAESHTDRHLERLFLFAMMWSLGAVLELDMRTRMAEFMSKLPVKMDWPGAKSKEWIMPFDYMVNASGGWEHWLEPHNQKLVLNNL